MEQQPLIFHKILSRSYNNGNTKIVNLLDDTGNENTKFVTKKWYVIDNESKGNYSSTSSIKFQINSLQTSLCDYSDAYILVTGNIAIKSNDATTKVAFKNCTHFRKWRM